MEPLSGATAFATIISLIGQFRSERSSSKDAEFNDFLTWLVEAKHDEIKKLVENNTEASRGIKLLLEEKYNSLMEKLETLDKTLASYSSHISGFSDITLALKPKSILSDQAFSILKQFEESGASELLEDKVYGGTLLMYIDGNGNMEIENPRFLEDDLRTLVELGLLRHNYNPKGKNIYIFTRKASAIIKAENS
jgi:hypothetical protein